jgi:hypothetical protein
MYAPTSPRELCSLSLEPESLKLIASAGNY